MLRIFSLLRSFVAIALLASVGLAGGAFAQNGLQRFEADIKPQLKFEKFTYSGATPSGANGFVLNNVVAVVPATPQTGGKASTVKIDKLTVEDFDFERVPKAGAAKPGDGEDMPRFARFKLEGMTGDDDLNKLLTPYGIPVVPVDIGFDYKLDPASKVLTVNKFEIALRGLARLEIDFVLDGISDKASKMAGTKDDGRLRTGTLVFDDKGLIAQLLPSLAKASGATAELWIGMAQAPLMGFAAGQGPETLKALDAVASYMADWKAPKGPLRVTIKPAKTASIDDLDKIMVPNALTEVFGLAVSYDGTRPGAATGGAATPPPRTATAEPPAAGGDAKRLTGKAAFDIVIGNTLTGRIDGKTYHEFYSKDGKLVMLMDGQISTGKWTIEGEKACTKFPDEDKDCYTVVAVGRTVTMTDAKGKGYRTNLLPGNPKDL